MTTTTRPPRTTGAAPPQTPRKGIASRTPRAFYWMVLPAFALFFLLHTVPVLQGVFYSFTDSPGYGPWSFVGLSNYKALFTDSRVLHAYLFTFQFAIVATILVNIIALGVAMALNSRIKFKTTLRGVYFIPYVLAILVIGYVFQYLFTFSIPAIAQAVGNAKFSTSILSDEGLAWVAIVILAVWQSAAFNIVLYLAGLQTVPAELYEAGSLDGAGSWKKFTNITFPMIWGFFVINMVLSLKGFLQVFDHVVAMTNGGPGTATESVGLVIYKGGFQGGEFGYQLANAVVFMIVIIVFALVQFRVLQREDVTA
jgi:raffinose/stachyose/melibiose transport system permease protein